MQSGVRGQELPEGETVTHDPALAPLGSSMLKKLPRAVIAAALSLLSACAGGAPRTSGPASVVQSCETAVYRSTDTDARVALRCGDVLGIWR